MDTIDILFWLVDSRIIGQKDRGEELKASRSLSRIMCACTGIWRSEVYKVSKETLE